MLPLSLRRERVELHGPRPLARAQERLEALHDGDRRELRVGVHGDRVTARVVPLDRYDLWRPVLTARLTSDATAVKLTGVLRPSWSAVFGFGLPFAFLAVGALPSTEGRWWVIGLALSSASVFWGFGPWFDRHRNRKRRDSILGAMRWALAASG